MKILIQLRNKIGLAAVLTIIIVALLMNNLAERKNFRNLEQSMDAMYKDRLMASNYLYGITNAMHQKHNIVLEEKNASRLANLVAVQNKDIETLVKRYNTTLLTKEESYYWQLLNTQLQEYNKVERAMASASPAQWTALQSYYQQSLITLRQLNDLQATEGKAIRKSSRAILLDTMVLSQTEIALLIVLGLIAVAISTVSENKLFTQPGNHQLN